MVVKDKFPHLEIRPDLNFMNELFSYNVRDLEITNSITISRYIIALSQYLIYLQSQMSALKASIYKLNKKLETSISASLTKEVVKQYSTKKDAANYLISTNSDLLDLQEKLNVKKDENYLLEGTDKSLTELIAAFKRELTRRDQERHYD